MYKNIVAISLSWLRLLVIGACLSVSLSTAQQVAVSTSTEQGAGILRPRERECYVITAGHVVSNPGEISITDHLRRTSPSTVSKLYSGGDIAILRVEQTQAAMCSGVGWPNNPSYLTTDITTNVKNKTNHPARLVKVDQTGATTQMSVQIKRYDDFTYIDVEASTAKDTITKGWSGSSLYIGESLVGMLIEINGPVGRAYRLDYVDNLIRPFFTLPTPPIVDPLIQSFSGSQFCTAIKTLAESAEKNSFESIFSRHDDSDLGRDIRSYSARVSLPGSKAPGQVSLYREDKHPAYVKYEFPSVSNGSAATKDFDVLTKTVTSCLPKGWETTNFNNYKNYDQVFKAIKGKEGPGFFVTLRGGDLTLEIYAKGQLFLFD